VLHPRLHQVHNFRLLFNGQAPPPLYVDQPVPFGTATLRTNATLNYDAIAQYSVGHHPAGAWPFSSVLHPICCYGLVYLLDSW
jgi:hypothetical protein